MATAPGTPLPTKIVLLLTLAATCAAVGSYLIAGSDPRETGAVAVTLALLTGLFLLRVVGQAVVRARTTSWLPPNEQWALTPYPVLLRVQLAILVLMGWIDVDFARGQGFWTEPMPGFGTGIVWFSFVYAGAMAVRYVLRMSRRPEQRWFGGAIPIVFHWVLAAYLFVLGSFHAAD